MPARPLVKKEKRRRQVSEESKGDCVTDKSGHMDGDAGMVDESETQSAHFGDKRFKSATQQEVSRTMLANDISADISRIPGLTPQEDTM